MTILVDGYNLLFKLKIKAKTLELSRNRVTFLLNTIAQERNLNLILIFDGKQEKGLGFSKKQVGVIEIIYTADGETADDYILDYIERNSNPAQFLVITTDRDLSIKVRRLGAECKDIDYLLFEHRLKKDKNITKPSYEEEPMWYKRYLEKAFDRRLKKKED